MCAWLFDITLCGVFNTGRFDLGWYAGRIYGLLAASTLLAALLIESASHYVRLVQLSTELSNANRTLERMCREDGLTRLANRRLFDTYLAGQVAAANRHKRALSLIMCDVDCFKGFNDHYGHQAGDECLKLVAEALQSSCRRPADLAARYGGEEFAIILPDTELIGAIQIAEAARDAVAQLRIPHAHSPAAAHVTVSCGVALVLRNVEATAETLIFEADQLLFQAKRHGRNCVIAAAAEQDANMLEFRNRNALRARTTPGR
jgi:diguanylate cyclase (GGDEF)-like protein